MEDGESWTYTYSSTETDKYDSLGNRYIFNFNSNWQITQYNEPGDGSGNFTKTTYDANGRLTDVQDQIGIITHYTYNSNGTIATLIRDYVANGNYSLHPDAVRYDYSYDTNFPEKVTDILPKTPATGAVNRNWQEWRYDYYPPGSTAPGALYHVYRVRSDGTTLDAIATYTYNQYGQVLTTTDASGAATTYSYDSTTGDLSSVTYPLNSTGGTNPVYQYSRDLAGRVTSVTDPLARVTSYTYDGLDRILTVTLPKPSPTSPDFITSYSYDNYDAVTGLVFTNQTDPNGKVSRQGYDAFGRLIQGRDAQGQMTSFAYAHGLLTSITDANGNVTSYEYDTRRRLHKTDYPDATAETYNLYGNGLLQARINRKGQYVSYIYDNLRRVRTKCYAALGAYNSCVAGSPYISYTYTGQMLTQVSDHFVSPIETHSYLYDSAYRLQTNTQGGRGVLNYTYTVSDRPLTYTLTGGPTVTHDYFADGSAKSIQWTPLTGPITYDYTLAGQYQDIVFPDGQSRFYGYDNQGRLTDIGHSLGDNGRSYSYTYDVDNTTGQLTMLGQRTHVERAISTPAHTTLNETDYFYDSLYQLSGAVEDNQPNRSWTYDPIGNRLTDTTGGNTANYTYFKNGTNPNNGQRLQSDGTHTYAYDLDGNITSDGTYTYGWDVEDRLISVTGAGLTASYKYDYLGRRTSKTVNGATTTNVYNGQNLIAETGANQADYLFGPGIDEPIAVSRGRNGVNYYAADGLGSVTGLWDTTGVEVGTNDYDSWGVLRSTSGSSSPFTYTARESAEAGLMYYRARYYNPAIGRFLSEDIAGEFVNRYAYVANNPLRFVDPSGRAGVPFSPVGIPNTTTTDQPPYGCHWTGDWSPHTMSYLVRKCTAWKLFGEEGSSGPGVGEGGTEEGALPAPTCRCLYHPAGIRELWEVVEGYRRPYRCNTCPPLDGFRFKWGPSHDEWKHAPSIYNPDYVKSIEGVGEGGEGCYCEEEICE